MKSERSYPIYKVNKKAEASLVGGHPWVYENDILEFPEAEPENGTLADVVSPKGAYLAPASSLSRARSASASSPATPTTPSTPASRRRRVDVRLGLPQDRPRARRPLGCRVIFGEADQFPGLTVDRFNNILVTQTLSVGMEKLKPVLFPLLAEVLRADGQTIDGIYERNGQKFSFTIQVRDYEEERVDIAKVIANELKKAGVDMQIVLVTKFDWKAGYNGFLAGFGFAFGPGQALSVGMSWQNDYGLPDCVPWGWPTRRRVHGRQLRGRAPRQLGTAQGLCDLRHEGAFLRFPEGPPLGR